MAKYIITQDEPTWLRCRYEVEAESEEDAERMMFDVCEYEYLGHEVQDRVDPFDNVGVSVERVDDPPKNLYRIEDFPAPGRSAYLCRLLIDGDQHWSDVIYQSEDGHADIVAEAIEFAINDGHVNPRDLQRGVMVLHLIDVTKGSVHTLQKEDSHEGN